MRKFKEKIEKNLTNAFIRAKIRQHSEKSGVLIFWNSEGNYKWPRKERETRLRWRARNANRGITIRIRIRKTIRIGSRFPSIAPSAKSTPRTKRRNKRFQIIEGWIR